VNRRGSIGEPKALNYYLDRMKLLRLDQNLKVSKRFRCIEVSQNTVIVPGY